MRISTHVQSDNRNYILCRSATIGRLNLHRKPNTKCEFNINVAKIRSNYHIEFHRNLLVS